MTFFDNFKKLSEQLKQLADQNNDGEIDLRVSVFSPTNKSIEKLPEYQISQHLLKKVFNIESSKTTSIILNYFDKLDGAADQRVKIETLEKFLNDIEGNYEIRLHFKESLFKEFKAVLANNQFLEQEKAEILIDLAYIIRSLSIEGNC